jgi:predicted RNA-binding protein
MTIRSTYSTVEDSLESRGTVMDYWLNLFTGKTWQEFQAAGSKVSGFRERNWNRARTIKPGDTFLCYLVGVKRWVGLLEVAGERYRDDSPIYQEEVFPVRFSVNPLVVLSPEHGVPMESLAGQLTFYKKDTPSRMWSGYLRGSPTKYKYEDGEAIAAAVRDAAANPMVRPVDPKKLERPSNLYRLRAKSGDREIETVVSVPSPEDEETEEESLTLEEAPTHTEIQWRLLNLGSQIGLQVWAPKSDREKSWNVKRVGDVKGLLHRLPTQFNAATHKTIENIDVLWLAGQTIVAAFVR